MRQSSWSHRRQRLSAAWFGEHRPCERSDSYLSWGRRSGNPDDAGNPNFHREKRLSVDFAADLNLEPAAVTIFSHNRDPMRLSQAKDNPVSVVIEFAIDPANRSQCTDLMREIRLIYLRNGARNWHLYEDFIRSNRFQMEVVASSWSDYQRQNERLTRDEKGVLDKLASLRVDTIRQRNSFVFRSIRKSSRRSPSLETPNACMPRSTD